MTDVKADADLQCPARSLPDEMWDVIIAGAGPAGSIAAIHLARAGHRVLLLDKERFPRDKVCGDALISDSIRCLRNTGLYEAVRAEAHESNLTTVYSPSREGMDIPGQYLTIRRARLDKLLALGAVESGAVFCEGEVVELRSTSEGAVMVRVKGADREVRGRVALIATGARVALVRGAGFETRPHPSAIGVRCYVRSSYKVDRLVIACHRSIAMGYGWIFPMGGGVYNTGCVLFTKDGRPARGNLVRALDTFLSDFPLARKMMQSGEMITPVRGGMERCGLKGTRPLVRGNVLVAGEAAGSSSPLTGGGIGKAMETGEIAASVIDRTLSSGDLERLREYPSRLERKLRPRYARYALAERWFGAKWIVDLMVRRVNRSSYLHDAVVRIITDVADPRQEFSLRGILKSMWG